MTALKAHEVERFLRRPDLDAGVFLAYGPDAGHVGETGGTIARYFAQGGAVIAFETADLDADPGRLAVAARTQSLFGERTVLRVRGAGKALLPTLTDLLEDPTGTVVVLEAGNLPPRDPLRALVEKHRNGRTLPCYADSDEALLRLINASFAEAGIAAGPDVAEELRGILGNDRQVTRRELEKLVLYAADSKRVTRDDVQALCADNAATVIDEIIDAAGTGHAARLDEAMNRALAAAVNAQQLLATAMMHFAALRRWRGSVDGGRTPREVLDSLRPRPHFSRTAALQQQLRLWSDEALAAAGERLHQATAESRKRYAQQEVIARRALLAICLMAAER